VHPFPSACGSKIATSEGAVGKAVGRWRWCCRPRTAAADGRTITLTFGQFKYSWADALDEKEAKELYDTFHVARLRDLSRPDGEREP
jgi:hypothetical protein